MALQPKATVKISNTSHDPASNAVDVMTLADVSSATKLPVYFCSSPFLLDDDTLRHIIDAAALHQPQPLKVVIDERTHEQHPDLMLSIQTYCYHNDDSISLDSIELSLTNKEQSEPDSEGDVAIVIGPQALLNAMTESESNEKTLVYIPDNLNDQLNLHKLLHFDQPQSLVSVVNTGMYSDTNQQRTLDGLTQAVDLAIAQDAHLFNWIEAYSSELINCDSDALAYLVMQYSSIAETEAAPLLDCQERAIEILANACGDQCTEADARAMLIGIQTHLSVLSDRLPEGADARVWQLLSSLGCTLWFDSLPNQISELAKQLLSLPQATMLSAIGELAEDDTTPKALSITQIEAAMQWLADLQT